MSACSFDIKIQESAEVVINKAKTYIESQGGKFTGNNENGSFDISLMGNTIAGTYAVVNEALRIIIHNKPIFIPCNAIESFLTKQLEEKK